MGMYVSIMVAMIGAMMFGLDQGNFGNETTCGNPHNQTADQSFENQNWDTTFIRWGATLIVIGATIGALTLAPVLASKCGRKSCIALGGFVTFIGCLMASWLSFSSVVIFMIGRFLTGFGVGLATFALPLYNAEISTPSVRGTTGSLF